MLDDYKKIDQDTKVGNNELVDEYGSPQVRVAGRNGGRNANSSTVNDTMEPGQNELYDSNMLGDPNNSMSLMLDEEGGPKRGPKISIDKIPS